MLTSTVIILIVGSSGEFNIYIYFLCYKIYAHYILKRKKIHHLTAKTALTLFIFLFRFWMNLEI